MCLCLVLELGESQKVVTRYESTLGRQARAGSCAGTVGWGGCTNCTNLEARGLGHADSLPRNVSKKAGCYLLELAV
jgi:hypothetical protein